MGLRVSELRGAVGHSSLAKNALLALIAIGLGAILGIGLVEAKNPIYVVGAFLGVAAFLAITRSFEFGLLAFVGVVTLLPFAVVPVPLGTFKLTALDITLSLLLLMWLARLLVTREERLRTTGIEGFLLVYVGLALFSFLMGTGTTSEITRLFLKWVNSILFFFTAVNCIRTRSDVERVFRTLILGGAVGAAIGIVLYLLPVATATRLLVSLGPLGYPTTGEIVRFIASTTTERAMGTAIDPNIFGAMLMIVGVLIASQVFASRPVLDRKLLFGLGAAVAVALLLTYSRGSWIGALAGVLLMATFRYRKVWLLVLLAVLMLGLGVLPDQGGFLSHLQSGLEAKDQAAAMRLGEYKDAFKLIQEYPFFGVGFGIAPDVDLYIGVSSVYLLLAEEMGLVGLASFVVAVGAVIWRGIAPLLRGSVAPEVEPLLLGSLAALVSTLVAGIFDHHFVNLQFPHVVALFWLLAALTAITAAMARAKTSAG